MKCNVFLLALQAGGLLNTSGIAQDLGLHRETVEHYVTVLERLFLVRRLSAWQRSAARRLVKAPKVHVVDSGLAATLAGVNEDDWIAKRDLVGHLLESFIVQQVVTQALGEVGGRGRKSVIGHVLASLASLVIG
jgi:uncharacterized protein